MKRTDDFHARRKHLADLTEEQLEERFWKLAEDIVDPLLDLASNHTSPSIERSVVMRMGFSSIESKGIVDGAIDRGLISKGVGNVIYKIAKEKNLSIREAGLKLLEGELWDEAVLTFKEANNNGN